LLDSHERPLRPGDFARVLLAAGGGPPRARARDQQADLVGETLRRRVLNRLVVLDPEPESLEMALLAIVAELGEPAGSTRAVCTAIFQEWEMARLSPAYWPFLIDEAMRAEETRGRSSQDHDPSRICLRAPES
jgi:hypothetical protein